MQSRSIFIFYLSLLIIGSFLFGPDVLAQSDPKGITQVNSFLENIIKALSGLAGLVATGFFVIGGLSYITSSGNPAALEKSKRTIIFAAFGLVLTIAAFALSDIVSDVATKSFGG